MYQKTLSSNYFLSSAFVNLSTNLSDIICLFKSWNLGINPPHLDIINCPLMLLSSYQTQELVSVLFLLSGPSQYIFQKVFLGCCSYYLYVAQSVLPDWAINLILGNFSNPLAAINLPKSPKFFCNFCKVVKIFNFSSDIIFGQIL